MNDSNTLFLSGSGIKGPPGAPGLPSFGIKGRAGPSGPPGMPGPKVTWTRTDRKSSTESKGLKRTQRNEDLIRLDSRVDQIKHVLKTPWKRFSRLIANRLHICLLFEMYFKREICFKMLMLKWCLVVTQSTYHFSLVAD